MTVNKKLLKTLLEAPGVSGNENIIRELIKKQINKYGFDLEYDNLGSIWGIKKSKKKNAKTILIDAHMDEVGFLITQIHDNGLISFEPIGGVWNKTLNVTRLKVWNKNLTKSFSGVVHFPNNSPHQGLGKTPDIDKMLLDIGAEDKKEVIKWGINIGQMVTFDTQAEFNGKRVISKSVDNRVGISIIIEMMNYISDKEFDFNIVIGGSAQEEVGLRGAKTSAYKFDPDLAIVVDVSPANDYPVAKNNSGSLGQGTMLRHKDARAIYSPKIIEYLRKLMIKNKIKYQDYFSQGGTNAGTISLTKSGIVTIPVGLVARSLHTGSTVFDLNDYEETLKLLELILSDLNHNKIVKFN